MFTELRTNLHYIPKHVGFICFISIQELLHHEHANVVQEGLIDHKQWCVHQSKGGEGIIEGLVINAQ